MLSIHVIKANGEKEEYNKAKVISSIRKAGIPKKFWNNVVAQVENNLYEGIPTAEIHDIIYSHLKKKVFGFHMRYALKRALLEFGPTGFPFERFVARVLKEYDYQTQTDTVIQGRCVSHEIDVLAVKDNKYQLVECKFHNKSGYKSNVQVPLYVHSRFQDIISNPNLELKLKNKFGQAWVFTNTRFTEDAIEYARCVHMRVTAWSYPRNNNIQRIIEERGLYPITVLSSISNEEKRLLLTNGIVTVKDILLNKTVYSQSFLKKHKDTLIKEIETLEKISKEVSM